MRDKLSHEELLEISLNINVHVQVFIVFKIFVMLCNVTLRDRNYLLSEKNRNLNLNNKKS